MQAAATWVLWPAAEILALRRLKQAGGKLEASLNYIARHIQATTATSKTFTLRISTDTVLSGNWIAVLGRVADAAQQGKSSTCAPCAYENGPDGGFLGGGFSLFFV